MYIKLWVIYIGLKRRKQFVNVSISSYNHADSAYLGFSKTVHAGNKWAIGYIVNWLIVNIIQWLVFWVSTVGQVD